MSYSVGDNVNLTNLRTGTIKFLGETEFADGMFAGVELDDSFKGKNDGSYNGKQYFKCAAGQGIFVRVKHIKGKRKKEVITVDKKTIDRRVTTIPRQRSNRQRKEKRKPQTKSKNLVSLNRSKGKRTAVEDVKEEEDEEEDVDEKRHAEAKSPTFLQESLSKKEEQMQELASKLERLQREYDETKKELEHSQGKLSEAQETIGALESDNAKLKEDYESLMQQLQLEREANEHAIRKLDSREEEIRRETSRERQMSMPPAVQDQEEVARLGTDGGKKKMLVALPTKSDWNLVRHMNSENSDDENSEARGRATSNGEIQDSGSETGGGAVPNTPNSVTGHDRVPEGFENIIMSPVPTTMVADLEAHDRILVVEQSLMRPEALKEEIDYYHELIMQQCAKEEGTVLYDATWNPLRRKLTDIILFENLRAFLTHLRNKSSTPDYSNYMSLTQNRKSIMYISEHDTVSLKKLKALFRKFSVEFFIRRRSFRRIPAS